MLNERQRVEMPPEAVSLRGGVKPAESDHSYPIVIRRAILEEGSPAVVKRRLWQKRPPPGTTLYLDYEVIMLR